MSDLPFQPDNELLSAYIDGQLSPDELRKVEAWLERDEAARAKVDELRGVSKLVQSLPKNTLPAEWATKLAQRLDSATAATGKPEHNGQVASMPAIPIGRSARGWWYSGAAVAAAVAIVCFSQFTTQQAENEVALKQPAAGAEIATDDSLASDSLDEAGAVPELRALDADTEPAADALYADESVVEGLADARARPAMPLEELGDAASEATASASAEPQSTSNFLIVWADVPPSALREQQINRVLAENGIQVEPRSEDWLAAAEPMRRQIEVRNNFRELDMGVGNNEDRAGALGFGGGGFGGEFRGAAEADGARSSRFSVPSRSDEPRDQKDVEGEGAEAEEGQIEGETILVEATADQIAACLVEMEQDTSNYATITVEPVQPTALEQRIGGVAQQEVAPARPSSEAVDADSGSNSGVAGDLALDSTRQPSDQASEFGTYQWQLKQSAMPARARRLDRPQQWYYYNTAPQNEQEGYQVRSKSKVTAKGAGRSKSAENDKLQQLANINRLITEQNLEVRSAEPPLSGEQPVQVLFVLRNAALAAPTSPPPAGETAPAESP